MPSTTDAQEVTASQSKPVLPAPILTLPRTLIRPYHPSDAPASAAQANDPRIAKYMRNSFPCPYTLASAEEWIKVALTPSPSATIPGEVPVTLPPLTQFAICRASDGAFVGGLGLKTMSDVDSRTMELGYWIGVEHWGKGYATEAVAAFCRWAFEQIPELLRVEAAVFEGNQGSVRVLHKVGFTHEGTKRKAVFKFGQPANVLIFGLLRDECTGLGKKQ